MLCWCSRGQVDLSGVKWHPEESCALLISPEAIKASSFQSRFSHGRLKYLDLSSLPRCRGHLTVFGQCWASMLGMPATKSVCNPVDLTYVGSNNRALWFLQISGAYCPDISQQPLTKEWTSKHILASHLNSSLPTQISVNSTAI